MKKKKKDYRVRNSIFSFKYFVIMFVSVCFCTGTAIVIFLNHMDFEEDIIFLQNNLIAALVNVLAWSLLFTVFYSLYKHFQFQKPTERILHTVAKIAKGDFSARIHLNDKKKRFRNEYDVIEEEFNKMAEELGSVETMRTDFIANVSHEMKTPLAVIQNYATILQDESISKEEHKYAVDSINQAAHSMSSLITNMLKLNKLENQQIFPEKTRYDLSEQIRECVLHFEKNWEDKNINLETDIPDEIFVVADKELTSLIWLNLLSNAFKFTPPNGTVSIKIENIHNDVKVIIADTGVGIGEEAQKHIFEKFYQCDTSHTTQGNGLGLALVKRICDIFRYRIFVKSEINKGTQFTVIIR